MRRLLITFLLLSVACDDGAPAAEDAAADVPVALADRGFVRLDASARPSDDFGEPCDSPADCTSGFCVFTEGMSRVCTRRCGSDADCPERWLCRQVVNSGRDVTFACIPEEAPCAGADLQTDPDHCGECNAACAFPNARAACVAGACTLAACNPGSHDLDGDPANGCEYACVVTRGGDEACDEIDNDCDGATDEGVDLASDVDHCGVCGAACRPVNGVGACVEGACTLAECVPPFRDRDGDPANGCEDGCVPRDETCDGLDDDCDGVVDEGFALATDPENCGACGARCERANAETACAEGACALLECRPGFFDHDGDPANGCEVGCQPTFAGVERCDEVDNDCDGAVDEGVDVAEDPLNCGACGVACARPNALVSCRAGACRLAGCQAGFFDRDGDPANGCEVGCQLTFDGVERCDEVDNDCDGAVDEGVALAVDPRNCGACWVICALPNGVTACVDGVCAFNGCAPGFVDLDGDPQNGCEYACAARGEETCDGADDDCDGAVDEGFALLRDPDNCGRCGVVCARPNATVSCDDGQCRVDACAPGFVDLNGRGDDGCELACVPRGDEACNARDDDCDGSVDEDFAVDADVDNCGACGFACDLPNATPVCVEGRCRIDACAAGFADADGAARSGCECAIDGDEVCDGADNDCDGAVDEAFNLQGDADNCGACGERCAPPRADGRCVTGACGIAACRPGFVDENGDDADGCECAVGPEACNGQDDDCDGRVDEDFDLASDAANCGDCNQRCDLANAGAICVQGGCRVDRCADGFVDLNGAVDDGCECAVAPEACDELDNDCDGRVDEDYDLQTSPRNCGRCRRRCRAPNGEAACVAGECAVGRCADGFVDRDGEPGNGCECVVADEVCDELDNDCDGRVDEGFDLDGDVAHCGACGAACAIPRATPLCAGGLCRVDACVEGFVDLDGAVDNGCECAVAAEACNGRDDDCDGRLDEDFDLQGDVANCGACGRGCAADNGAARCVGGECAIDGCEPGFADRNMDPGDGCECAIAAEVCNGVDDDCDTRSDEGFDLQRDVAHCGACRRACALENATPLCANGACRVDACDGGWVDRDGAPENGCECAVAPEVCDEDDDDCDGRVDEGFDLQGDPNHCGACGAACALDNASARCAAGQCAVDQCDDGFEDLDGAPDNGCECAVQAEVCDGDDDDCDGRTDEGFDLQGDPANCGDCGVVCDLANAVSVCGGGACLIDRCNQGFGDADGDDDTGCECAVQNGGVESCDARDEDCDGAVDETFDLDNDPENCGVCGRVCDLPHATSDCDGGACAVARCDEGWVDANGDPDDGCEEAVVDFPYDGTYPVVPGPRYTCFDSIFGEVAFSMIINRFTFAVVGDQLRVSGGPTQMTQGPPAPNDGSFAVGGTIDGGAFGCTEIYALAGDFVDNDNFAGVFSVDFQGFACDLTDCVRQTWNVVGTRE